MPDCWEFSAIGRFSFEEKIFMHTILKDDAVQYGSIYATPHQAMPFFCGSDGSLSLYL